MTGGDEQRAGSGRIEGARLPGAAWLIAVLACLTGLGAAGYLTVEHYTGSAALVCPQTATLNCLKVTTSQYATVAGIPVAVAGLVYLAVMTGAVLVGAVMSARGSATGVATGVARAAWYLQLLGSLAGMAGVLWLVYAELFLVGAVCLWCTAVHVVVLALFLATSWLWVTAEETSTTGG